MMPSLRNKISMSNELAISPFATSSEVYSGTDILNTVKFEGKIIRDKWSLLEIRLFNHILSLYNPVNDVSENRIVEFSISSFMQFHHITRKYKEEVIVAAYSLMAKVSLIPKIENGVKEIEAIHIFSKIAVDEFGFVRATFSKESLVHVQGLKSNYVSYSIANIVALCSSTLSARAPQLYVMLKAFFDKQKTKESIIISTEDLLEKLAIKSSRNLIEKTINPSIESINKNTDIFIEFKKILGANGKIIALSFDVSRNTLENLFEKQFDKFFESALTLSNLNNDGITVDAYKLIKKFKLDEKYGIDNLGALLCRLIFPLMDLYNKKRREKEYSFDAKEIAKQGSFSTDEYGINTNIEFRISRKKRCNNKILSIDDVEFLSFENFRLNADTEGTAESEYGVYLNSIIAGSSEKTGCLISLYFDIVILVCDLHFSDHDVLKIIDAFKNNKYCCLFQQEQYYEFYCKSGEAFREIFDRFMIRKNDLKISTIESYRKYLIESVRNYWKPISFDD